MRSRRNNARTATQPSNNNGGTAYKISSWWSWQPKIVAALKEGSNTSTNNEDATGRDDIETANSNNNKKNPMQRKKPSMTATNHHHHHHHHTCNSSNKQRVSSRHHRESSIATSILAGLILLFSIGMFLGSNLHIIMNLDTASESTDTAVNHLAYRNNPINTFAKEEITDDDQPKQSAEVEVTENQYSSAVEVLDNKEIIGGNFEDQSEILQHDTLAVLDTHNKHTVKSSTKSNFEQRELDHTKLEQYGVVEYEFYENPSNELQLPVTMLVHHREFFAGCHSFERFFSPKWSTIIVVETDMAIEYQLRELAAATKSSPSIHLALLDPMKTMSGEWLGRQVALEILKMNHGDARPPLLLSTQCDIHPLPKWHLNHRSYEDVITRMVYEFLEEDRINNIDHDTNVNEYRHMYQEPPLDDECKAIFDNKLRPTLVMNTIMVETIPRADTMQDSVFHSLEAGLSQPWQIQYSKPNHISAGKPWMSDISTWVEDHFNLYNVTLLEQFISQFANVYPTISEGVRALPIEICRRGWKAIRLNDEPMFIDYQKIHFKSIDMRGEFSLHNAANYNGVDMDWLLSTSIVNTAKVNSPVATMREYMKLRVANYEVNPWVGIAGEHFEPHHIPPYVWNTPIKDNLPIVIALMHQLGYVQFMGDVESREYISFVRIPAFHTIDNQEVVQNLKRGMIDFEQGHATLLADGNESPLLRLPITSTLKEDAFFRENKLLCWGQFYAHNQYFDDGDKMATEKVCALLHDETGKIRVWIPELESFASICDGEVSTM